MKHINFLVYKDQKFISYTLVLDLTLNISNLSHQCITSDFLVKFSIMDLCVNIVKPVRILCT